MRDKLDLAPAAPAHLSGSCRTPLVPALLSEGTNGVLLKTGTKHMKLITDSLADKLLANGRAQRAAMDRGDDALDFKPVVKLFTSDAQCTWLLTELDPDGGLAFGLCDLGLGCPELGYVSLVERSAVRGKLGLPIERDQHFIANETISVYAGVARARGCIVT